MKSVAIAMTAAAALASAGCETDLECGLGTLEVDGACVVADGVAPESGQCGLGTHFDPISQTCTPNTDPTECGPNTVPQVNDDGVIICVGQGGGGCGAPLVCPEPSATGVSVCGSLFDLGTDDVLIADDAEGEPCDPQNPTETGPCSLVLNVYDALAFPQNPRGTSPLASEEVLVDDCGRYRMVDIKRPFNGVFAIALDDATTTGGLDGDELQDAHRLSVTGFATAAGETRDGVRLFAMTVDTDEAWTASAGDPFEGQTFAQVGVYAPIFLHGETPVPGVKITAGGTVRAGSDYYFADATAGSRLEIDAGQDDTGTNGTGLIVNSSIAQHSGTGSEPAGCSWPTGTAAANPGMVFYQDRHARLSDDLEVLCP